MTKETNYGSNMLLITTFWGQAKTFKLMPINNDCPYMEVIYDIPTQMLVSLSKTMKENYEMLPKLDDDGELIGTKKPKRNGKPFKEERRLLNVPQEFYLIERNEQENFINTFAINATSFDFKKYLDIKPAEQKTILQPEAEAKGVLVDANGRPIKAMQVTK